MRSPPWRANACATSWLITTASPASFWQMGRILHRQRLFRPQTERVLGFTVEKFEFPLIIGASRHCGDSHADALHHFLKARIGRDALLLKHGLIGVCPIVTSCFSGISINCERPVMGVERQPQAKVPSPTKRPERFRRQSRRFMLGGLLQVLIALC